MTSDDGSESMRSDTTMEEITIAVTEGRNGHSDRARVRLLGLWKKIGVNGDPLHRCTLAHYIADLFSDPAEALMWDVRALDAADALTDHRVREHHASLRIAGFYPSLHLNIADNLRRLGSFAAAREHIDLAHEKSSVLPSDAYGSLVRTAIDEVAVSIGNHDTSIRESAPNS